MMEELVLLEKRGHIAIITLNNPKTLNALNVDSFNQINKKLDIVEKDMDTYVLIITGEGKAFAAGADITEMLPLTPVQVLEWGPLGSGLNSRIEHLRIPVIAAVNGFALGGGCELSLACDIRIASEKAKFGQPEVTLGIIPGFGGTQRLPRAIGSARAKELIYTGRVINSAEAYEIGLVNKVVAHDDLMKEAMEMALQIAANAQIAVQESKKAITVGLETDEASGLAYELQIFALGFSTEDQKIGMKAFVDKKKVDSFKYR